VPTVNECEVGKTTRLQVDPALPLQAASTPEVSERCVKHWHIGVASQAAYEPPTDSKINLALHDSQQRTDLPQIEILMI